MESQDHAEPPCAIQAHFIFAVIGITVMGYLSAGLHLLYPESRYPEYAFIGFVGAMLVNAIVPHLVLSIRFRSFCPGVITGCLLIAPFHVIILRSALNRSLTVSEVLVSTLIVGAMLLGSIPVMVKLAGKIFIVGGINQDKA
jgi:hypothetical protein